MSQIKIGIQHEPLNQQSVQGILQFFQQPQYKDVIVYQHYETSTTNYNCSQAKALLQMMQICEEALSTFDDLEKVALIHRIGNVNVAECSIICAVNCTQRKQAFEACDWMINEFKNRVKSQD